MELGTDEVGGNMMISQIKVLLLAVALAAPSLAIGHTNNQSKSKSNQSMQKKLQKGEELLCQFAPDNELNIPAGLEFAGSGIDEKTFNSILDRIERVYEPIVKSSGGKLKLNRKWSDGTVNASASRKGKTWTVNMYGGLARHSLMSADGFAMVMCHELGHHLGGFPRSKSLLGSWPSNEGQSDYFGAMKCFRRVYENEDNVKLMSQIEVPAQVTEACSNQFKSAKEIALCQRTSLTGKDLATVLWSLNKASAASSIASGKALDEAVALDAATAAPEFSTPSTTEVSSTNNAHPQAQCRLDTYFAGSICPVAYSEDFGKDSAAQGACAEERGDKTGVRSRCWYKPGKN
jgi:hypothetical protein